MTDGRAHRVAFLELQASNLPLACAFYTRLFGWRAETLRVGGQSYVTLDLGGELDGGVVERGERPLWLPYVEVDDICAAAARALALGGEAVVAPREGPAGWRATLAAPGGAEIALWQPKR
jgi:predicted enzyme related to lactoylglutathione lyase